MPISANLVSSVMNEHIRLPGVPQVVCTRAFAYHFLTQCGHDAAQRGFGSLDYIVFHPPALEEPLSDLGAWEALLDSVEASASGLCIVRILGKLHSPRIVSCTRCRVAPEELGRVITRTSVDFWIAEHTARQLHSVRDFSVRTPVGVLAWQWPDSEAIWRDSLSANGGVE